MHEKPRDLHDHIINPSAVRGFVGFGLLAAVFAYGNFLLFFVRHHLSPQHLNTALPLYHQATTLTYLTPVLCLYIYLLFERSDVREKFFSSYLWSNKKLLIAFALSFLLIGNIIYNPWVQPYFSAGPLTILDWLSALLWAGFYLIFRLLQRGTHKHPRPASPRLQHELSS